MDWSLCKAWAILEEMKIQLRAWFDDLFDQCHHSQPSERTAILYCLILAAIFVGSLYIFVPPKIRKLERDHPHQIQWRTFSSLLVCTGAVGSYPLFFCDLDGPATFSILDLLRPKRIPGVLLHTLLLYLGPIVASLLRVYEVRKRERSTTSVRVGKTKRQVNYTNDVFSQLIKPSLDSFLRPRNDYEKWINRRNFIIAPLTEEVVFRGCMVPALLASGMTPLRASLIAPLFFGVAHFHHAIMGILKGNRISHVVLSMIFQFGYTSLFGCYVAYAFVRTGSIGAVTVSHVYCNWMGLPDLSFIQSGHPLHLHRYVVLVAYAIGVLAFKWFFSVDNLLPMPATLTQVLGT